MKTISLFFILLVFELSVSSCKNSKQNKNDSDSISLIIGDPLDYGVAGTLIFPVGSNYNPAVFNDENDEIAEINKKLNISFASNSSSSFNDRHADAEWINPSEQQFDIKNILFYDQKTGKSFPLLKDTLHILSFAIHKEFKKDLIFYRIVRTDINKDKKYNSDDAVMLYCSNLHGDSLTQLTPDNERFLDYFYYDSTQTILVKTMIDANRDSTYSVTDETNFREVNLLSPAPGREIFSKSLKDSLRF